MLLYQIENFGRSHDFRRRHHDRFVIPAHIHEYSEFLCVTDGVMTMTVNGAEYRVPAGHVAFVLPNDIHSYSDKTRCHVWCAVFSNDFIGSFLQLLGEGVPACPVVDLSERTDLLDAIDKTDFDDTLRLTGLLNLLYSEFLRRVTVIPRPKEGVHLYKAAVEYISQHFTEDISLATMANHLGYHEKYLSSALHALTNMNFCMFLSSYRVDFAKRLLRESAERSISQVALEAGFASINTFNRVFKRLTGVTPTEYRCRTKPGGGE